MYRGVTLRTSPCCGHREQNVRLIASRNVRKAFPYRYLTTSQAKGSSFSAGRYGSYRTASGVLYSETVKFPGKKLRRPAPPSPHPRPHTRDHGQTQRGVVLCVCDVLVPTASVQRCVSKNLCSFPTCVDAYAYSMNAHLVATGRAGGTLELPPAQPFQTGTRCRSTPVIHHATLGGVYP